MNRPRTVAVTACLVWLAAATAAPVAAQSLERCGDISGNQTWATGSTVQICAQGVQVRSGTLTIQPGVDVIVGEGASLVIGPGAALSAVGAQEAAIRFRCDARNEAPGCWGQIRIESGAEASRLAFAILQFGGKGGVPMVEAHAVVEMNALDLRGSGDVPLAFAADVLGPSLEAAGNVTVGQACRNIVLQANNTVRKIGVIAGAEADVSGSQTWHNFCVPYRITEEIGIGGPDNPELRLDVGFTAHLSGDGGFRAGLDEARPGQLLSNGTPTEPVLLTSAGRAPGDWVGLDFTPWSGFSGLNNTRVEYGGKGGRPMVQVRSLEATTFGSSFAHASGYPLALLPEAVGQFLTGAFASQPGDPPVFEGNGTQRVLVLSSEGPNVSRTTTWGDPGVPFEMDGDLFIGGSELPTFSLSPGAHLMFHQGRRMAIGDRRYGPAQVEAVGTADRPVRLTGTTDTPGAWEGLRVAEQQAPVRLDHVAIEYGGSPMVQWARTPGDITRSTFLGAAGYPLVLPASIATDVVLDPDAVDAEEDADLRSRFEGNASNRVQLAVDRTFTAAFARWRDPGAPVEVAGLLAISSPSTPVLSLQGGLRLVFAPAGGIRVGDGASGFGSLIARTDDAAARPISLGAADPEAGWAGIEVMARSTFETGPGVSIADVADGAAAVASRGGRATLAGVELRGRGRGTGAQARGTGATVTLASARVTGFRTGLHAVEGGHLSVSRSIVSGNAEWGFRNENPNSCLPADLVYWGGGQGPRDESAAKDECTNAANEGPGSDRVSDGVNWWPYAVDESFTPSSGLGPNPRRVYLPWLARRR